MRRERWKKKKQCEAEKAACFAANLQPSAPQPKQNPAPAFNHRAGRMPNAIELESIEGFKHADMMPIPRKTVNKVNVQRIRTTSRCLALDGKAKCRLRSPSLRLNCTNIPPAMSAALGVEIFSDQITTVDTHYGTLVTFFDCPAIALTDQALTRHTVGHRCAEEKHEGPFARERKYLGWQGPDAIGHSLGQRRCRYFGNVIPQPHHD